MAEQAIALVGHFIHLSDTTEYPVTQSDALSRAVSHFFALSAVHFAQIFDGETIE